MAQQIIIPASSTQTKLDIQKNGQSVITPVTLDASTTDSVLDVVLTPLPAVTTYTLFGSTGYVLTKKNDGQAVELGVKFKVSQSGSMKGIRFYKLSNFTGAHTATLWSSSGAKLASAKFVETASGWQEVLFATPVPLATATTYTASVYFTSGDYISTNNGLSTAVVSGPLSTIVGSNGVFKYGTSGYPTSSYQNSNYYVDVIFSTSGTVDTTSSSSTSSTSTSTSTSTTTSTTQAPPPPSAIVIQGFGSQAVGGSGTPIIVTSKSQFDSIILGGSASGKIIKFGTNLSFTGRYDLVGLTYCTIDANGYDITIDNQNNGDGISFDGSTTHHCILSGIRVINAGNDGINVLDGAHDIVITNCSSYGNRDGNIDIAGDAKNVTVQWCFLGGGASGWSGDMLITSTNVSVHHNLFAPATTNEVGERCPFAHCNYSTVGSPNADVRNNVIWRYGRSGGTGSGYGTAVAYNATGNVVNNYYYTTGTSPDSAVNTDDGYGSGATGKVYAIGNVSGNGVNPNTVSNHAEYAIPTWAQITLQPTCQAARDILLLVGPAKRNSVEQGIITSITLPTC